MKINEVLVEVGFWKGVAQAIAPQTMANLDAQRGFKGQVGQGAAFEYEGNLYRLNRQTNTWEIQDPINKEFVPASQIIQDKFHDMANASATPKTPVKSTTATTQTNLDTNKIAPVPKLGAPTSAEQATFQEKLKAAMKAQGVQ